MASEKTPRRLGRGLDALFSSVPSPEQDTGGTLKEISLREIRKNPFQPRKDFGPQALKELQDSLKSSGLLQPITVRRTREGREQYELIAGERRLRAATELGWATISAVIKDMDDRDLLALALVENLQRSDLNPVEEAEGYSQLITEFGHTQQTIASMVGRDRSTVANMLRILQLPDKVRQMIREGSLSSGQARPLLALEDETRIIELAREVASKGLSARDVEQRVRHTPPKIAGSKRGRPHKADSRPPEIRSIEEQFRRFLQTDVFISLAASNSGTLKISFYSTDDLERIADLMGVTQAPQ
ncbi:MAG: ParB/RepB/Spo0J family partition protein [Gemmatimonadaceae bacterium]